ncbi:Fe-S oxidoreductase [Clostridia bacterium]|nr:Fe-S oxidoreductase [Clostridia bacterium]
MKIVSVQKNSPADLSGICVDDVVLAINGHNISDVLDYRFYSTAEKLTITLQNRTIKLEKDAYQDLGITFETYLMDEKKNCRNNCIFCFIDQMPKGLRDTLYFKDDDARLSFLQGNYITLTNLSDRDVERIIKMNLSVNVSVHTTNPELRHAMLNNRFAGKTLSYLFKIARAKIALNCQIVLCKGWNDGKELLNTLRDLTVYKSIESIAVVPVGLTKFREGLTSLDVFTKQDAIDVVKLTQKFDRVYAADEFYLLAELPIPEDNYYNNYPQYENGVGMLRYHIEQFEDGTGLDDELCKAKNISIATGVAAYDTISALALKLQRKTKINFTVFKIKNRFFGETITVAGLLTATDIIDQLKGKQLGEYLLLTKYMLNSDGLFLDNLSVADVEQELGVKVKVQEFL